MSSSDIQMFADWDEEAAFLSKSLRAEAEGRKVNVLEAGCGQRWPIDIDGLDVTLVGVDLDEDALAIRVEQGDLHHAIHGDLRTADLPADTYDVIYNSFVLEHIPGAEGVLDNFVRWAKPGGVILIRFPDRDSVFGFITRFTPHWFHVFYKRWVVGNKNAGKPGHEPYETFYDPVVSRKGFVDYCERSGLEIVAERGFPVDKAESGTKMKIAVAAARVFGKLSFGRLATDHMWLTYVVKVPE